MLHRALEHFVHVLHMSCVGSRDEGGPTAEQLHHRVDGTVDRTVGIRLGTPTNRGGGARLVLGQPIDEVVHDDVGQIDVLPGGVVEVVTADREAVSVTPKDKDMLVRAAHRDARGQGKGSAVDEVDPVRVDEVGESARAADSRDADEVSLLQFQLLNDIEERSEDGEVTTCRAPRWVICFELLFGELFCGLGRFVVGHGIGDVGR